MNFLQTEFVPKLVFVLGIINLLSGLLVLFTCRCIPVLRISGNITKNYIYRKIYRYHCYIWWVFWISVVVHAVFAIAFYSIPF